ncbi:MAG: M48 family peptidase, partial [Planctomycetota bacterium]
MNGVAERLVTPPEDEYIHYRFNVLRNPVPNAFALPDGQIYVHSGMLARLGSEAELAGLLGHEINHVRGHHSIVGMRSRTNKQIAGAVAGAALSIGLSAAGYGSAGSDLASTMNTLLVASMYSHSRTLEEEADRLAVGRMVQAGYDPRALPKLFELLMEDPDGVDPSGATIWATHPAPALRVLNLREQISRDYRLAELEHLRVTSDAFEARRLKVAVLTIGDYVAIEQPRTALRLGRKLAERYPDRADIQVAMGDAFLALGPFGSEQDQFSERDKRRNQRERYRKTRDERWAEALATETGQASLERNARLAVAAFERARTLDPERVDVERGMGDAQYLLGELRAAGRHYVSYLKRSQAALDRERVLER